MIYKPSKRYVKKPLMNEQIRVQEVRVIDDKGENLGVLKTKDAIEIAKEKEHTDLFSVLRVK